MTEEKFTDLFQEKTVSQANLNPGDQIEATIAGISGENIFLDIGGKSEGILNVAELGLGEEDSLPSPGDTIRVYFLALRNGEMIFTTRIGSGQASLNELEEAYHAGIPVEGTVTGEIKGGFSVSVAGTRAFCPYSQMDIRRITAAEDYLEQTFSFKIIEFSSNGRNIILSARAILEEQRAEQKEQLQKTLEEGMLVKGTVASIRNFGAFVDLGGVDGLIPISELAWGQTEKVEDILSLDQEVQVMVKSLDWEKDRISLSLRDTLANPWDSVEEQFPEGSVHSGIISRLANFGAFVSLTPGIDGLLHISKLGGGRRINHPREVVEEGQEFTVKIEGIDKEQKRISLVPEDYTEKENKQQDRREKRGANKAHKKTSSAPVQDFSDSAASMGTFGDLLKAQLKKK